MERGGTGAMSVQCIKGGGKLARVGGIIREQWVILFDKLVNKIKVKLGPNVADDQAQRVAAGLVCVHSDQREIGKARLATG